MITSLSLKGVASYPPDEVVSINELKKVNFFFGFNGSGKSTIARLLQNIAKDPENQLDDFNQCTVSGYDSNSFELLAFDEDFTSENFIRSNELKGVFSLNQSNAEIDAQIEIEEANIRNFEAYHSNNEQRKERFKREKKLKEDALLEHCWNQRKTFQSFSKIRLDNSGSKPNHLNRIREELQSLTKPFPTIDLDNLNENYHDLFENELNEISNSIKGYSYLKARRAEFKLKTLLSEIIVGNEEVNIAEMIKELDARKWVEKGIEYLDKSGSSCPFCQKDTIDDDLIDQFGKLFDETYKTKLAAITSLKDDYAESVEEIIDDLNVIQGSFNPDNVVSTLVLEMRDFLSNNLKEIEAKLSKPNEVKSINSLSDYKNKLSDLNQKIKLNNDRVVNLNDNKEALVKNIWIYMAINCQPEIEEHDLRSSRIDQLSQLLQTLTSRNTGKIIASKQKIEDLRSQTINTREAVDNINSILKNSGFDGFEIDEKEVVNNISRYYLKRPNTENDNSIFKTLSEGEKNFISFLYFYQRCLGTDDIQENSGKKKIVVIDDPVSSLDSQSLFIVSTLIRNLIRRKGSANSTEKQNFLNPTISQVFILTHNLYFYKEVSLPFRLICTKYWHYYVAKANNKTTISDQYNRYVKDDYSLMWANLKDIKSNLPTDASQNILISNTMRRIIESYVKFIGLGPEAWSALIEEDENDPSQYIKTAFVSIINDESHGVQALDTMYYQKIINEQPQMLFDVFASIFLNIGKEHYEMMMEESLLNEEQESV
jgi:wobble nucleotide-excising tRNase